MACSAFSLIQPRITIKDSTYFSASKANGVVLEEEQYLGCALAPTHTHVHIYMQIHTHICPCVPEHAHT